MNIFWLHEDPWEAAKYYCDKHVTKINVEVNQLLSTALRDNGYHWDFLYDRTHANHPLSKWVGESNCNFEETLIHSLALGDEYTHRYGGTHKSHFQVATELVGKDIDFGSYDMTERPQAMPDRFKVDGDYVEAYRNYYREGKDWEMSWTDRPVPEWY